MSDDAHNVSLLSLLVNRVTHGFTVNGEALILLPKHRIPFLEGGIELNRVDTNQNVTDDRFTGDEITSPPPSSSDSESVLWPWGQDHLPNRQWPCNLASRIIPLPWR